MPATLEVLLAAKPDLEVVNIEGYTPLWSALIARGSGTNVQVLIEAGAEVRRRLGKQSPVQYAVQQASAPVVSSLLKAGADANERDQLGNSLLHYAVSRTPDITRLLLEHNANPNVLNKELQTPLSMALSANRPRPAPILGGLPVQPSAEEERDHIVAVLKQDGADEFMQRRLRISARRGAQNQAIFTRGTNALNRFTLMEFLGAVYKNGASTYPGQLFPWPDFGDLRIHRLHGTNQIVSRVNLMDALESGDCSRDQWLEWGDEVEIPERIHPLSQGWGAVSATEAATLTNCTSRKIQVLLSGTNVSVRLQPLVQWSTGPGLGAQRYIFAHLPVVLRNEREVNRHLRASSDLSRVTVQRTDPITKELRTMLFDVTDVAIPNAASGSIPLDDTLWLRDGDVIEIPQKP
jgi:hypothetical protein